MLKTVVFCFFSINCLWAATEDSERRDLRLVFLSNDMSFSVYNFEKKAQPVEGPLQELKLIATRRLEFFSWSFQVGNEELQLKYLDYHKIKAITLKNLRNFKFFLDKFREIEGEKDDSVRSLKTNGLYAMLKCLYKNEDRAFRQLDPEIKAGYDERSLEDIYNMRTLQDMIAKLERLGISVTHKRFDDFLQIDENGQCTISAKIVLEFSKILAELAAKNLILDQTLEGMKDENILEVILAQLTESGIAKIFEEIQTCQPSYQAITVKCLKEVEQYPFDLNNPHRGFDFMMHTPAIFHELNAMCLRSKSELQMLSGLTSKVDAYLCTLVKNKNPNPLQKRSAALEAQEIRNDFEKYREKKLANQQVMKPEQQNAAVAIIEEEKAGGAKKKKKKSKKKEKPIDLDALFLALHKGESFEGQAPKKDRFFYFQCSKTIKTPSFFFGYNRQKRNNHKIRFEKIVSFTQAYVVQQDIEEEKVFVAADSLVGKAESERLRILGEFFQD